MLEAMPSWTVPFYLEWEAIHTSTRVILALELMSELSSLGLELACFSFSTNINSPIREYSIKIIQFTD